MIAFSGLDGAGKSTQIELLQTYFSSNNKKSQLFWSRGGYTPGMELLKQLMRKSSSSSIPKERGNTKAREVSFSKPLIRKTWLSLAILDLMFFYGVFIRFKELFGTKVICDRYVFDTSIDFKLNFPQENVEKWVLWKLMKLLAVKPQKHFVLTISVNESIRRSKLKNEPFPDSRGVLEKRLEDYITYSKSYSNTIHINCEESIETVQSIIFQHLKK